MEPKKEPAPPGKPVADPWNGIVQKILIAAILAASGMLIRHEVQLAEIRGNRFTDEDAYLLRRDIESRIPPEVVRLFMERTDRELDDVRVRVRQLEVRHGANMRLSSPDSVAAWARRQ